MRTLVVAFVVLLSACAAGCSRSETTREPVSRATARDGIVDYFPPKWIRTTQELSKRLPKDVPDIIHFVYDFPRTPQNAFASEENHDPVAAWLFYGVNVCDDSARVAHHLLRSLGRRSRLVFLDGHVALEIWDNNKWNYVDTYKGAYISKDGVPLSSDDLRNKPADYSFTSTDVNGSSVVHHRSDIAKELYQLIDDNDTYGTEALRSMPLPSYTLLPGDRLDIKKGIDRPFTNYRIVENEAETAQARRWYWQLIDTRKVASADIESQLRADTLDIYNSVSLVGDTFRLGNKAAITSYFSSASPLLGVRVSYTRLVGRMIVNVLDRDTGVLLGSVDITHQPRVDIPFDTLRPNPHDRAIRDIAVTIALTDGDNGKITNPIIQALSQITPKAAETF